MAATDALQLAVRMMEHPSIVRTVRRAPLPDGIDMLLRITAGEPDATAEARAWFPMLTATEIGDAARFFIQQILFNHRSDSYRILGARRDATDAELRRNMVLLMKWLHPDTRSPGSPPVDAIEGAASILNRVTQAWETLKTRDRREAYDAAIADPHSIRPKRHHTAPPALRPASAESSLFDVTQPYHEQDICRPPANSAINPLRAHGLSRMRDSSSRQSAAPGGGLARNLASVLGRFMRRS